METDTERLRPWLSPRHGSNAWALRPDVVDAWRRGAQLDVRPMTAEYSPAVVCNADCYGCPYRRSRLELHAEALAAGAAALEDDLHSSTRETARRVVDAAYEGGVRGLLWTGGGEPTIWSPLLDLLRHAAERGIANGLYTNGFVLGTDPAYARRLLEPERNLAFVRVSINTATARTAKLHWGVEASEVAPQLAGLARLLEARNDLGPAYGPGAIPSIQVSTIIDRNNVGDLPAICSTVAQIFGRHRRIEGVEDRMIVRPMTFHRPRYSSHDHSDAVIRQIIGVCGTSGIGRQALSAAGVDLFLGFGLQAVEMGTAPDYSTVIESIYAARGVSLATGLFLTIGPSGAVYSSTERNTDNRWTIGDLRTQTVEEIYGGERRRRLLDRLNEARWGPDVAQATSRTERLDRIAAAIRDGVVSDDDVRDIGKIASTSHRLILD